MSSVQAPSRADLIAAAMKAVESQTGAPAEQVAAPAVAAAPVESAAQSAARQDRTARFIAQKRSDRQSFKQNSGQGVSLGGVTSQQQGQAKNRLGTEDYQKLAADAKIRAAQTEELRTQVTYGLQEIADAVPADVAKAAGLKQGVDLKRDRVIDEKKGIGGILARSSRSFTRMIGLDKKQDPANFTIKGAIQKSGQVSAMMNAELGVKIQNIISERANLETKASWARGALKETEIRINDIGQLLIDTHQLINDIQGELDAMKTTGEEQTDIYAEYKEALSEARGELQEYSKDAVIAQDDATALNGFLDVVQGVEGSGGLIQAMHDAEALNTRVQRAIAIENELQASAGGAAIVMQEATQTADIARVVVTTSRAITEAVLTTTLDQQGGSVQATEDMLTFQNASNGRLTAKLTTVNASMAERRNAAMQEAIRRARGYAPSGSGSAPAAPTKSPLEAFRASRRSN